MARNAGYSPFYAICSLFGCSPNLEELSFHTDMEPEVFRKLGSRAIVGIRALGRLIKLRDLHFMWSGIASAYLSITVDTLTEGEEPGGSMAIIPAFISVRRLAIQAGPRYGKLWLLPAISNLEIVVIHTLHSFSAVPSPPIETLFAEAMPPDFARQLRISAKLHTLFESLHPASLPEISLKQAQDQLDQIEESGDVIGTVYSYRCSESNDSELLHFRYISDQYEISDTSAVVIGAPAIAPGQTPIQYIGVDGLKRERIFERRQISGWQQCTDWDGICVPLEILEKMRVAEGISIEGWKKRGVEVGKAAWGILRAWREGLEASEARGLGMNDA